MGPDSKREERGGERERCVDIRGPQVSGVYREGGVGWAGMSGKENGPERFSPNLKSGFLMI